MGLGKFSWCLLNGIFRWLRRGIFRLFCRRWFHGEIWKTISPVFRVFQRKLKMVSKKAIFLAFLRQPLWPNDILVAPDGQAERKGATFASWDTFENSQEHREFSNLVTLKTAKVSSSAIWLIWVIRTRTGKTWTNVTYRLKVRGCYVQRKAKNHTLSSPTI